MSHTKLHACRHAAYLLIYSLRRCCFTFADFSRLMASCFFATLLLLIAAATLDMTLMIQRL